MQILENKKIIIEDNPLANITFIRVCPENLANTLLEIITELTDMSWLNNFTYGSVKESFRLRAIKTCDELKVKLLKTSGSSNILSEAGEYIVSCLSKKALVKGLGHKDIPLMELLGRKKTGNPGFDFYTENDELLVAGEAKFLSGLNAYNNSLKQINEFISENKHKEDIGLLFFVASEKSLENMNNDLFGVCAAFSATQISSDMLIQNIKSNVEFKQAINVANVYLVAVNMYE